MLNKFKTWHKGLSQGGKVLLWAATAIIGGSVINAAANPAPPSSSQGTSPTQTQSQSVVETKTITETEDIPFSKTTEKDSGLEKGKSEIKTEGINGIKTLTYEVTYTNGQETNRKLIKEEITVKPINQVTSIGTYVKPKPAVSTSSNCDPNYSGACVPIASDVDCAGGSGNGPAYVNGPVYVTGSDIYDLDRDGNGVGCE